MTKFLALCICILFITGSLFAGCGGANKPQTIPATTAPSSGSTPWLDISCTYDRDLFMSAFYTVPGTEQSVECSHLDDIRIRLDGEYIPVEEAVNQKRISPELIFAYARLDASEGNCQQEYLSYLGVAHFFYYYPEYAIDAVFDVKETPDGKQHLISGVHITHPQHVNTDLQSYFYPGENFLPLDTEDWGIIFEVISASPTGITLRCTQAGGQHIGQLKFTNFMLDLQTPKVDNLRTWCAENLTDLSIENDGVTDLVIDWQAAYGEIPSGEHRIRFTLTDIYDPDSVHPLMVNFKDHQDYFLTFTIP